MEEYPVFISYEVSGELETVKAGMFMLGYTDYVLSDSGKKCYLPESSLHKLKTTTKEAVADLKRVVNENFTGIRLERCMAVPAGTWEAILGKPYG
jgi:hypothetical protein